MYSLRAGPIAPARSHTRAFSTLMRAREALLRGVNGTREELAEDEEAAEEEEEEAEGMDAG